MILVSIVHWYMAEDGWTFEVGDGVAPDTVNGVWLLHELHIKALPDYSGRVTVPVLWDAQTKSIVSNESSEIIRMFSRTFDEMGAEAGGYYPQHLRAEIDHLNERIYETVNNGVYRCGFATKQYAYKEAVLPLFETLDCL